MTGPVIKGWCPGAHRPMVSGDGLVVRVRPFRSELSAEQCLALCDLSQRYGNGTIDLTSRANLQIRGVAEDDHPALLRELDAIGVIDADPAVEGNRNILMPPDWVAGDLTSRLYDALLTALPGLNGLPEKMGFALDTGPRACLGEGSADFRFELSDTSALLLRADGAASGLTVTEGNAMGALAELAAWFGSTGGPGNGRMARHLRTVPLPESWQGIAPRPDTGYPALGPRPGGVIFGVAFGQIEAGALSDLMQPGKATGLRAMPGRRILLRGDNLPAEIPGFISDPASPLLSAHACPGAPYCPQATVETRAIATRLAATTDGASLHVSGCAKGCAHPRAADITLTGRDGRFDLVRGGMPWDPPAVAGLIPSQITDLTEIP